MCGIVGGYGGIEPEDVRRMMGRIAHRGPDDDGLVEVAGNALGHRRLSIVDVEGGKQPLGTPDKGLYLVGNGEVYNHEEILETLEDRDMTTRRTTRWPAPRRRARPRSLSSARHVALLVADATGLYRRRDPADKALYWGATRGRQPGFVASDARFDEPCSPRESLPPGHYWTPRRARPLRPAVPADATSSPSTAPRSPEPPSPTPFWRRSVTA